MAVLIAKLQPELTEAVTSHVGLYRKYWEEDRDGNMRPDQSDKAKFARFEVELIELLDQTVEVDVPKRLPQAWFEYVSGVTPEHILALMPFIEQETEDHK